MDRFYNSVILYDFLYRNLGTLAVGTCLTNRKFYPDVLKKKMKQGEFSFMCHDNIVCMTWMDKQPIHSISNFHDPNVVKTCDRKQKDGSVVAVPCPDLVKDFHIYMGGCDVNDQVTRLTRTRRHYRWPHCLFIKMLMWACFSAYHLMNFFNPHKQ